MTKDGKFNLVIYDNRTNIDTIYTLKVKRDKVIYLQCNLRPKYKGTAKFEIDTKKFFILNKCNTKVSHNTLNYKKIIDLIDNNKIILVDFSKKKSNTIY